VKQRGEEPRRLPWGVALELIGALLRHERVLKQTRIWLIVHLILTLAAFATLMIFFNLTMVVVTPALAPAAPTPIRTEQPTSRGSITREIVRDMVVTAYTCDPESTGKGPGHPAYRIAANGSAIGYQAQVVAAPPDIPFGSVVIIPGYGTALVVDRGEAIQGDRMDVHIESLEEAQAWGVRRLPVKIILPKGGGDCAGRIERIHL